MADVQMVFGILLFLGIAFPGLLTTWWLLFPATVKRAQRRLEETPWKSFWLGLGLTLVFAIPAGILFSVGGGVGQFLGWALITMILTFSGIGAAGIAAKMGEILIIRSGGISPTAAFVRGAVALELAAIFPLVGWLIVIPLAIIASLGATTFALLRWTPRERKQPVRVDTSPAPQV